MQKPNPMLAKLEAKLEAKHEIRRMMQSEIDLAATMIAANNELKVGAGRAGFFTAEVLDVRMQIAKQIVMDDDPELLYTKCHLAKRLKEIYGKDWPKYKELYPMLREYWD
jgi:hypothetical protein